jgi:hypothetical protein
MVIFGWDKKRSSEARLQVGFRNIDGAGKSSRDRSANQVVNKSPKKVEASTSVRGWHRRQFALLLLDIR